MVPLLIHLPPLSEDIEIGSRDVRDVVDENISKSQTMYSIIASTFLKGFKSQVYGQRHFSFEIIGSNGLVQLYAAVPVALVDVVKQAIASAYPSVRLEEISEQNIFSPIGKLTGTMGGELSLKEPFAYPIATFQEVKRDAMQTILNALSTLDKEDGAGIQILVRPAKSDWRKRALAIASHKRKGGGKNTGSSAVLKSLKKAVVSADEQKAQDAPKPLSNLDQALVDSIEEKTRYPGFEVLIRVIASSNISSRAQVIVGNIVSSFAIYDSPGKNGFKYTVAKDIEKFVTAYILRFFPPENDRNVLNSMELATLFHFPDQNSIPTSQLERQSSKQVDGPRNLPETGLLFGYNLFRGVKKAVRLALSDRQRHVYVVGGTGTGKTTFLENLALQDMLNGDGFAFVDPHGDAVERLLAMVPKERTEDIIYFNPSDRSYPMGLNLFEFNSPDQKDFLIQEAINMLYKLYDPMHQGIMGPRYEHLFRNAALTVMADPAGGTFIDIPKLFRDPQFVQQKLKHVTDQNVIEFWQKEVPNSQRSNEYGEVTSWFISKFGAFLSNEMMRNIIGQTTSSFNLREVMDDGKILLVNLSKGKVGELNSKLLGMVFVMKFQAAAMSRANVPESERRDFCLYVDEFQNFSTDSFGTILSEARKFHLNLIVANQFTTQLTDEIRDSVFGNMGSIVAFRVGQNDVDVLARYFQPLFDAEDLVRVPNFNAIIRTLVNGVPTQPFSMATLPPLGNPNENLSKALKQLSAAKYGHPRAEVEDAIFARLKTIEPPKPAFPGGADPWARMPNPPSSTSPYPRPAARAATPAGSTSSFLDEWLSKRQNSSSVPRPLPANPGTSTIPDDPFAQTLPKGTNHPQTKKTPADPAAKDEVDISDEQAPTNEAEDNSAQVSKDGELKISHHSVPPSDDTLYIDPSGNIQKDDQAK